MELTVNIKEVEWWFWVITLFFILCALIGWTPGYYIVMALSAAQIVYFTQREGSATAFQTQVRIAYFIVTLLGLWAAVRFPLYIFLFVGTSMVAFTGRCVLALALKKMPWNRNLVPGASCEIGSAEK
jgi:hypothetical protein